MTMTAPTYLEYSDHEENALTQSLVWLISVRGGNSFFARVVNNCEKRYFSDDTCRYCGPIESPICSETKTGRHGHTSTLCVSLAPNGRFFLDCNLAFINYQVKPMQKLIVVHEAGHIALRHVERFIRIYSRTTNEDVKTALMAVYNIAMDLADNDTVVRIEPEFKEMNDSGEFTGLLPEKYGFPSGLSMEEYILLILSHLPKFHEWATKVLKASITVPGQGGKKKDKNDKKDETKEDGDDGEEKEAGEGDESGEGDDAGDESGEGDDAGDESGEGEGEGEGEGGSPTQSSKPGKGQGKPGKGRGKGQGRQIPGMPGTGGGSDMTTGGEDGEDNNIPDDLEAAANKHPQLFKDLLEAFHRSNGGAHKLWNDAIKSLNAEEATTLANKLKQHTKQLARSALEQTQRSRGFIPASIQNLLKGLLADEQIPWTSLFEDFLAGAISSRVIDAMTQPCLSLINVDNIEPWPGNALDFEFYIDFVIDTSGSVQDVEFARACNCINGILRANKSVQLRVIHVDAAIQHEEETSNVTPPPPSPDVSRYGQGGTVYTPAFKRILGIDTPADWADPAKRPNEERRKPDLVIVFSDGGVVIDGEVFPNYHPGVPIIWLLASNCHPAPGMNDSAPDRVIQMFPLVNHD